MEVSFLDGTKIGGRLINFDIKRKLFHLLIGESKETQATKPILFKDLKAVYFLKGKERQDEYKMLEGGIRIGDAVSPVAYVLVVEFQDGEFLHGSTHRYGPDEKGFYLVPNNPESPYEKIYVNQEAVKKVDSRRLIGGILLEDEKITALQLEKALKKQEEKREEKIGSILKEQTSLTDAQLQESLAHQRKEPKKRLGEILLDAGYLTQEQVQNALKAQKEGRAKRLGEVLVEMKYVTPNDICLALSTQFRLPWVDLSGKEIDPRVVMLLPGETARSLQAVPIDRKEDGTVVVVICNPQEKRIKEKLEAAIGQKAEVAIAYQGYIEHLLDLAHGKL